MTITVKTKLEKTIETKLNVSTVSRTVAESLMRGIAAATSYTGDIDFDRIVKNVTLFNVETIETDTHIVTFKK